MFQEGHSWLTSILSEPDEGQPCQIIARSGPHPDATWDVFWLANGLSHQVVSQVFSVPKSIVHWVIHKVAQKDLGQPEESHLLPKCRRAGYSWVGQVSRGAAFKHCCWHNRWLPHTDQTPITSPTGLPKLQRVLLHKHATHMWVKRKVPLHICRLPKICP